jgi:hypothetical protein
MSNLVRNNRTFRMRIRYEDVTADTMVGLLIFILEYIYIYIYLNLYLIFFLKYDCFLKELKDIHISFLDYSARFGHFHQSNTTFSYQIMRTFEQCRQC